VTEFDEGDGTGGCIGQSEGGQEKDVRLHGVMKMDLERSAEDLLEINVRGLLAFSLRLVKLSVALGRDLLSDSWEFACFRLALVGCRHKPSCGSVSRHSSDSVISFIHARLNLDFVC